MSVSFDVVVMLLNVVSEVEETLKRIQSHKGVLGIIVVNNEGIPIRTTLDNSTTVQYAGLIHQLAAKARSTVRDIDPQNDLTFLRIRSKKHEIMIAPDKEYMLIVIQNPSTQISDIALWDMPPVSVGATSQLWKARESAWEYERMCIASRKCSLPGPHFLPGRLCFATENSADTENSVEMNNECNEEKRKYIIQNVGKKLQMIGDELGKLEHLKKKPDYYKSHEKIIHPRRENYF
eukprot:gene19249-21177_t